MSEKQTEPIIRRVPSAQSSGRQAGAQIIAQIHQSRNVRTGEIRATNFSNQAEIGRTGIAKNLASLSVDMQESPQNHTQRAPLVLSGILPDTYVSDKLLRGASERRSGTSELRRPLAAAPRPAALSSRRKTCPVLFGDGWDQPSDSQGMIPHGSLGRRRGRARVAFRSAIADPRPGLPAPPGSAPRRARPTAAAPPKS